LYACLTDLKLMALIYLFSPSNGFVVSPSLPMSQVGLEVWDGPEPEKIFVEVRDCQHAADQPPKYTADKCLNWKPFECLPTPIAMCLSLFASD
jgi:hypothetical protein